MVEQVIQEVSLVGKVIEDLIYESLNPGQFKVEVMNMKKLPQYKNGGFFVFSDLRPGTYTFKISGDRFQPQEFNVTIPLDTLVFDSIPVFDSFPDIDLIPIFNQPGDNELIVIAETVNGSSRKITFDPVILKKKIKAGALVLAQGSSARLASDLDSGKVENATLNTVIGLAADSIVRIIRDKSIRLKFDPYYQFPFELTRIVGKVVFADDPEIPLEGVRVRLTQVNGTNVKLTDVAGASIVTTEIGGVKVVLGTEKDMVTFTNQKGDYHFYFKQGQLGGSVTLEASLSGYQSQDKTSTITENARNRTDFELIKQ
jgi:hypothetical protein